MKIQLMQIGTDMIRKIVNLIVNFVYLVAIIFHYEKKRVEQPLNEMKNVLLINLSGIGDVICTTPAIRTLKNNYPDLNISMVVSEEAKEIIFDNANIENIIPYEDRSWKDFLRLIKEIREEKFDLSILFFGRIKGSLLILFSGAKNYLGFLNNNLYEIKKFGPQLGPARIMVDKKESLTKRHLKIVESIGCSISDDNSEIFLKDEEKYVGGLLYNFDITKGDLLICLNPDTDWDCKKWNEEKFAELGDRLHEIYGAKIIISGSASGIKAAQKIAFLMENDPIILAGRTTIKQLAAVLNRCDLLITVDSAPLHIAQAVGTPTITLFGPTDYRVVFSQNDKNLAIWKSLSCSPCYNGLHEPICNNFKCMDSITVYDVLTAINLSPYRPPGSIRLGFDKSLFTG